MKCYAPWHAISIRFNGDVVPDCVYTGRHGNILHQSLLEIFSDTGLINTRKSISQGILPPNCNQCTKKEQAAGHSRRVFFQNILNPMLKDYDYSKEVNEIYFLEFNMSNICNLKCRMCSGVNSTAWIKEDLKIANNPKFYRPIDNIEFGYRNLSANIVDRLFEYPEYFKNLQYLNIKGGEPYMEPANKQIMKKLIDLNLSKNITLDISTNGTIIDLEFDELALQFKETKWHVSIEGVGKMYDYIRGGNNFTFDQMVENVKTFKKFTKVIFAGTVMTYNVNHLNSIRDWFKTIKENNFELHLSNTVTTPSYLNPCILPNDLLINTGYTHDSTLGDQLNSFIEYTLELDKIRNTNVLDVCPEFSRFFS
jgi:MoaA/NifB/PqqE/SkfB family radical SAM enzyme